MSDSTVDYPVVAPARAGLSRFLLHHRGARRAPSVVVAGSGEAPEGKGNYRDHIVARGDTSSAGLRRKAIWVLDEMERRMAALGGSWQSATAVQMYTEHNTYPLLVDELERRGVMRNGLTWQREHPCALPHLCHRWGV